MVDEIEKNSEETKEIKEVKKKELLEERKENEIYEHTNFDFNMSIQVKDLGRLKKTLSDLCPCCEDVHLQLRVREIPAIELGEEILEEESYRYCPKCESEFEYTDKKQKRKRDKGAREVDLEEGKNKNNGRYQKSPNFERTSRTNSSRSDRGSERKGSQRSSRKY